MLVALRKMLWLLINSWGVHKNNPSLSPHNPDHSKTILWTRIRSIGVTYSPALPLENVLIFISLNYTIRSEGLRAKVDITMTIYGWRDPKSVSSLVMTWRNRKMPNGWMLQGGKHCTIVWDGMEDQSSSVVVRDLSSNGTYVSMHNLDLCLWPTSITDKSNEDWKEF